MVIPPSLNRLVEALRQLPGIGPKTAMRLAFYILSMNKENVEEMARALVNVKKKVRHCSRCRNLSEEEQCSICRDSRRDSSLLCVVQHPQDIMIIEKTGAYKGFYFVLHGALSPVEGIGPEELHIPDLLGLIKEGGVKEVIIATNPDAEGDATAYYIAESAADLGAKVTRIGFGLPVGGDLEYADELTMSRALESRRLIE